MLHDSGNRNGSETSTSTAGLSQSCCRFEFDEILLATDNFNESLVVGEGGFGKVYKGNISIGTTRVDVAIKRLDLMSNQGEMEFWAEVEMLSKLRHAHLVSLIGYSNYENEMILVYEYMPNGTLEDHLHKFHIHLSWLERLKICIGAARGLDYLHTGTGIEFGVIHRDVKSSNILLHESWAAKISDFGLARIGPTNQPSTYVNTLVKGTFGYIDPNYFATGKLTRKSDVYAFGVVLFEVLCQKRPLDKTFEYGLATWIQDSIKEGNLKQIVYSGIRREISPKCLKGFARIAERCLDNHPNRRPTMTEVVFNLESLLAQSVLSLQQKTNNWLQTPGKMIFGRIFDVFSFRAPVENSEFLGIDAKPYTFSYRELRDATGNFSTANKLGEGGFGPVYKGALNDGRLIAVKQLSVASHQGKSQFEAEIATLSVVQHRNLVKLYGCCIHGVNRLLVYEYLENKSLDQALFGKYSLSLSWYTRFEICLGVARGLVHLHEESRTSIIHRDVKASNVLLDSHMIPKISDFGLARLHDDNQTHMSTRVAGTIGYLAPEYAMRGHLTKKADVFSFGVVALEIISGRPNSDSTLKDEKVYLLEWAWNLHEAGTELELVDKKLSEYDENEVRRVLKVALLCTQTSPTQRPSMSQVVAILSGDIEATGVITRPEYLVDTFLDDSVVDSRSTSFQSSAPTFEKRNKSANTSYQGTSTSDNNLCPICITVKKDMAFGCGHQGRPITLQAPQVQDWWFWGFVMLC
uniref:G-type lectin S-receptor-like serine/threonine-protein kinase At1g11330 isoform X2 n=1 Tax=Erigeron canadensis TaxID=72917 RepID=UPI001CB8C355|nr:G-type lectin S-receptor-like serine/threonine-protein kinase At1g11330 isoform X2 [Erigeron canadensis]